MFQLKKVLNIFCICLTDEEKGASFFCDTRGNVTNQKGSQRVDGNKMEQGAIWGKTEKGERERETCRGQKSRRKEGKDIRKKRDLLMVQGTLQTKQNAYRQNDGREADR